MWKRETQVQQENGIICREKIQNSEYKSDLQFSVKQVDSSDQIRKSLTNRFFTAMQLFLEQQNFVCGKDPIISFLSVLQTRMPSQRREKIFCLEAASTFLATDAEARGKEKVGRENAGLG